MIPYFELRTLPLGGGVRVTVFGTLVAIGVFAGLAVAERRARRIGIPERTLHAAIAWTVAPGFLVAHLVALAPFAREPEVWSPRVLLAFWNGMSAFGGLVGAYAGFTLYRRIARVEAVPLAETLLQGLVVGWVFGRLGCTLVHDHIGKPSTFWTAIAFPGGPRHDLGLYELCFTTLVLLPTAVVLDRRPRSPGAIIAAIALLYAPARFLGDFLRNTDLPHADVRYLGLTAAQYACIGLAGVGFVFARGRCHRRRSTRDGGTGRASSGSRSRAGRAGDGGWSDVSARRSPSPVARSRCRSGPATRT
jgi:phosphatidylglycerol:prolipoprotein diacylglycerol transferase